MIFVSDKDLHVAFKGQRRLFYPNGEVMETRPRIYAHFTRGGAPDWVLEYALRKLTFAGLSQNELPEQRLTVWDSIQAQNEHRWTDEEREEIETWMLHRLEVGDTKDYMLAEQERAPKPWDNYNRIFETKTKTPEQVAEQIYDIVVTIGIDPLTVILFEQENKNREEVIERMRKRQEELVEEGLVVEA